MPIKLLHHKSWHPYRSDNVAKVKRDVAKARGEEEESDRRLMLADSEARLDRMRKKAAKKDRNGAGQGEKELDRQLKGLATKEPEKEEGGTMIIRPEGWKGKGKETAVATSVQADAEGKHINFWSEFEAGAKTTQENPEVLMEKAKEKEHFEGLTKVYLAKKGEGMPVGWYAAPDGKTERERKEPVEQTLERAYKDGEHKRLSDPLALMNSFLKRRTEVFSGSTSHSRPSSSTGRERYLTPSTPGTDRGDFAPIVATHLLPKRRRGDPIPPPSTSASMEPPRSSAPSSSSSVRDPKAEAASRVSSERARAAALLKSKKRSSTESIASETPRSEVGGWGMYNRDETREAKESRGWARRDREDDRYTGGGWGEQKQRRADRERNGRRDWGR